MGRRRDIIRVGDRVRIDNPQMFVKCGYRRDIDRWSDIARRLFRKQIAAAIQPLRGNRHVFRDSYAEPIKLQSAIEREIGAQMMRAHLHAAKRTIQTKEWEALRGQIATVSAIRYCKTGSYSPARGSGYWDDYDPPYLSNEKTHKILTLNGGPLWNHEIEAIHVTKVSEEANERD